ncbi:FHA domain-containing protein [Paraburkholderia bryophila]|uniref:Putative component of type VI protein secretion system n=1 Tax=Paraburkholderia bryophila TaxID=420952 RepID=A0A7Y9WMD4_9BURK|nr:FHA domain-containing protein [Paraburkholderia bryophila]NYH23532.1 putative component of type VI protein secretion system [Paraburkholderia bryophila]
MPSFSLQLMIVACHGKALSNEPGAVFDAAGGSIGRAPDNTLVLPDDDDGGSAVARRHALIGAHGDGWQLLNTSEHAAIAVNGKLVEPRGQIELHAGDIVNIGAYVLRAAACSALPVWNLPGGSSLTDARSAAESGAGSRSGATADSAEHAAPNPLYVTARPRDLSDDRPFGPGTSTSLHDLLDTPLDPLALFEPPATTWSNTRWNDANVHDLFADLTAAPPGAFDASRTDNAPGHALRDHVAEFDGHLRVKIATPMEETQRHSAVAQRTDYADAFGRLYDASACVVRVAVPNYGGETHGRSEPSHKATIDGGEAIESAAVLAHAFLDGAGVPCDAAAEAGLTPEFMHTLGTLVRTLKQHTGQN